VLRLPVEELLGQPAATEARVKPGQEPAPARHMERINALSKTQQKFLMQMIETVLAQQGR